MGMFSLWEGFFLQNHHYLFLAFRSYIDESEVYINMYQYFKKKLIVSNRCYWQL